MPSFRLNSLWTPASAPEVATAAAGERDVAPRQAQTTTLASGPTPRATLATAAPTAELPLPLGHTAPLEARSTGALVGGDNGLNPLSTGAQPVVPFAPESWPPNPFAGQPSAASAQIWQAIDRDNASAMSAPRPTIAFGFAHAFDEAALLSLDSQRHSPVACSSPVVPWEPLGGARGGAESLDKRRSFSPGATPEADTAVGDGAFWYRHKGHAKSEAADGPTSQATSDSALVGPRIDANPPVADGELGQQQVFEQAALVASFAPMSAQIAQQRIVEQRRKESLQRARSARKTMRLLARGRQSVVLPQVLDDDAHKDR